MNPWTVPALLVLGIAAGPQGLDLLSAPVLLLVDPGIAMALAILGVFVGLGIELRQSPLRRTIAAAGLRTGCTIALSGAALAVGGHWLTPGALPWLMALMFGICAAVSDADADVNADDVLMIVAGGVVVSAIGAPEAAFAGLLVAAAFVAVSIAVATAGWLLVGQTNSEAEQHVFVVGSLLLLGGAATYLFQSAALGGLVAGLMWNAAGGLSRTRILRDLHYFQHPLVVLGLAAAGATATLSIEALALAAIFVVVRTLSRPVSAWITQWSIRHASAEDATSSHISAGLVGIALAFDVVRLDGRPDWGITLLSAVVIGSIVSAAVGILIPAPRSAT